LAQLIREEDDMIEITVHGATVIVDATRASGKLRPKTRKDAMILGVGVWPLDMDELRRQRAARAAAVEAATKALGAEPVLGWRWFDTDDRIVFIR